MRALTTALCLLSTPALADVAGVASVIDGDTIEPIFYRHGLFILRHRTPFIEPPKQPRLCIPSRHSR